MNRWVQRDRAWGEPALKARKQGGSPRPKLNRQQLAQTTRLVRDHAPDQLELPYALWTREAVGQLIQQQWGVRLSQQAVGNYLRAWGLSPQKPTKRAREQCPEALRNWMEHQYQPCTGGLSGKGPQFTLGDEMGLRSDHQAGTCWAPKGRTPVVETTGQRFGCNLISTLTNRGTLRFQVFASRAASLPRCFWTFCAAWCARYHARCFSSLTAMRSIEPSACGSGWLSTRTKWNCSTYCLTVPSGTRTST